jgi:hypothetical protein
LSPLAPRPPGVQPALAIWLGWAIFLGVSWTWCIGMFLPVILVHDYGAWAWIVFAIPNVVGAAAMGWTINADQSRRMVESHRIAMTAFSIVTIAFQIFFAVWIFGGPSSQAGGCGWYLFGILLIALAALFRKRSRLLASAIYLASIACAIGMMHHGEAKISGNGVVADLTKLPAADIGWLTPVCLFGFLFCPYLDTTFHRARQRLGGSSAKLAFGIGFGVIFFSAIVLSLLYARPVHAAIYSENSSNLILRWIKLYWMIQLGFTIGVHLLGDDAQHKPRVAGGRIFIAMAGLALGLGAWAVGIGLKFPDEIVYRYFLSFYGLLFPAYVWLCIVPGRGVLAPTRRAVSVFAAVVLITSPMYWLAFINYQLFWGVLAVAVLLLSRLLIAGTGETPMLRPI